MELSSALIRRLLAVVPMAVLLVAACASGPSAKVFVRSDPAMNVASFHTYAFEEPLGTDRAGYSSLLSKYLKAAAARELEARGYRPDPAADFLVNFNVQKQDKLKATSVPSSAGYGGYYGYRRGYYSAWPSYETQVTQYTEGTLSIDIVNAAKQQLIWEGTAIGRLREKDRENLQPLVDAVVAQVFENFPHQGGGAPVSAQ